MTDYVVGSKSFFNEDSKFFRDVYIYGKLYYDFDPFVGIGTMVIINNNLIVEGDGEFKGDVYIEGNLDVGILTVRKRLDVGVGGTVLRAIVDLQGLPFLTGKVGICNTQPSQVLDVIGNAVISGRVGIGTTIPIQTLHVEGSTYISGNLGIGSTNPTVKLGIDGGIRCNTILPNLSNSYTLGGSDQLWSAVWAVNNVIQTSDQREKTNITPSDLGLNFIQKLNPVSYKWINGGNTTIQDEEGNEVGITSHPGKRTHYGLLSQEVKTAFNECGAEDFAGWVLTDLEDPDSQQALNYSQFISPMIKAIQEQQETINQLTTTATSLLERIELLENPL
jgi:hypothetical protein